MDYSNQETDKRIELRQHQRRVVPPTCLLSFARFALSITFSGDSEGEGSVINLSIKGCKVESDAGVKVGDAMSLILLLSGGEAPTRVDLALVRWANGQCFGLEFVSLGTAEMNRLRTFLASAAGSKQ
ncbi:MAG: PilZ domain-containing protein [Nitrospira sp.]